MKITPARLRAAADLLAADVYADDDNGVHFMCWALASVTADATVRAFEDLLVEHGVTSCKGNAMREFRIPRGRVDHVFRQEVRFMFLEFLAHSLETQ